MLKMSDDIAVLWNRYTKNKDEADRDEIILHYVPLVKSIVYKMVPSYSKFVDSEDLMSCGIMGLIHAVDRYETSKGVPFESYAYRRIKGEVIDYLRRQDFISTSLRQKIKAVENAIEIIERQLGRPATENELCEYLKMDIESLRKILDDAYTYNIMYLEDVLESCLPMPTENSGDLPEKNYEKNEMKEILEKSIGCLNDREQLVITLYYYEDLNIKEIGEVLGVSESRVSQIHSKALMKLRSKIAM